MSHQDFRRCYEELMALETFEERFRYLQLHCQVGIDTFGFDRYMNQDFYRSKEWQRVRSFVITRDNGCDLGISERPIAGAIYVHHIVPITPQDIIDSSDCLLDPNNLICVSHETHNAIHYGDDSILHKYDVTERTPNDTSPWRQ